jgi:hypothetical protein
MPKEIGSRVGAMGHADQDNVYMFGYGVYEGDHTPPKEIGGFNIGVPNPRIKLDSGKTVYGCECWWGSEAAVKKQIGDRTVIDVDIDEARATASR